MSKASGIMIMYFPACKAYKDGYTYEIEVNEIENATDTDIWKQSNVQRLMMTGIRF